MFRIVQNVKLAVLSVVLVFGCAAVASSVIAAPPSGADTSNWAHGAGAPYGGPHQGGVAPGNGPVQGPGDPNSATPDGATSAVAQATSVEQQHSWRYGDPAYTPNFTTSQSGQVAASSSDGTNLTVQLPNTSNAPTSETSVGSSSVVSSDSSSSTAVVNQTQGGLQISQVLSGPSSPTSFSYQLNLPPGVQMVPQTSGGNAGAIALTSAGAGTTLSQANTIGYIQPAWAADANGASVPTSFSVNGNTLTQSVDTSHVTAWPVVADPEITFGWVIYLYFSHAELAGWMLDSMVAGAGGAFAWICSLAGVGVLTGLCAIVAAMAVAYFTDLFHQAYARGGGIVLEFTYWGWYWGSMFVGSWS